MFKFYEFFAGGGMARLGLGGEWECLFANDICEKKAESYRKNFGDRDLLVADVGTLDPAAVPDGAQLAWASFPCQDLSLAGNRAGLNGGKSGSFWGFWNVIQKKNLAGSRVPLIVLENVVGAITSQHRDDFKRLIATLVGDGYAVGALVVDAVNFLPQSRQRLFIVGVDRKEIIPEGLCSSHPSPDLHPAMLIDAFEALDQSCKKSWSWWKLSEPKSRSFRSIGDVIEWDRMDQIRWDAPEKTEAILQMMADRHRQQVMRLHESSEEYRLGTIYRRTRTDASGQKVQRAELRLDGISGCLRTPGGGSSRQTLIFVKKGAIRTRLLTSREAARLMGLPDSYRLPAAYNEAYHLLGDGLAVPVVAWLARGLLTPLAAAMQKAAEAKEAKTGHAHWVNSPQSSDPDPTAPPPCHF